MTNVQRSRRQVRLSRALGIALTPKAQRIFEKRPYAPGEHGRTRRRTESITRCVCARSSVCAPSTASRRSSFAPLMRRAPVPPARPANAMLSDLETRLDALVLRAGFARTTAQARQSFVVHRHILVDGNVVDRPSYRVKPGQTIQVKAKSQTMVPFQIAAEGVHRDVAARGSGLSRREPPVAQGDPDPQAGSRGNPGAGQHPVRRRILFALIWIFYQQGHTEKTRRFALRGLFVVRTAVSRRSRRRRWPRRWT